MKSITILFFCLGLSSLASGDRDAFNQCMSNCYNGNNGVYDINNFKKFSMNWRNEEGWEKVQQYCSQNVYPFTHSLLACADNCDKWDQNLSDLLITGMDLIVDSCNDLEGYYKTQDCLSEKSPDEPVFDFGQYSDACSMVFDFSNHVKTWTPSCALNDQLSINWVNYNMEEQLAKWSIQKHWDYMSTAACSH